MLSRRKLLASAALAGAAPFLIGCTGTMRSSPSDVSRTFGVGVTGLGSASIDEAHSIATRLGKPLDVINVYEAFAWRRPLPIDFLRHAADTGTVAEITWEPWDPDHGGADQPEYSLQEIAAGRFDEYIKGWATDCGRYAKRVLMRFGHEMNGDWYPWSVRANGGSSDAYVAAFRHVHQLFSDAGATQVEWVWSPNVVINGDGDAIRQSYPGVDVVDIIGIDGYNFGNTPGHVWTSPADLFSPTLDLITNLDGSKALWINEVGCSDIGGDKFEWWADLVQFLLGTTVSGLVPFEVDKNGRGWPISGAPDAATAKAALKAW